MSSQFAGAPDGPVQLLHWCHLCSAELLYCPPCCTHITNHTYNAQHLTSCNGWDCQTLQSELYWEAGKEGEVDFSHLKSLLNQHWIHKCSSISYASMWLSKSRFSFLFRNESFGNQQPIIWICTWWIQLLTLWICNFLLGGFPKWQRGWNR